MHVSTHSSSGGEYMSVSTHSSSGGEYMSERGRGTSLSRSSGSLSGNQVLSMKYHHQSWKFRCTTCDQVCQ